MSLRLLLIQRAARLQERSALSAPPWGTLGYPAFRNRVEGVALGLMAAEPPPGARVFSVTGGPWDWACEVAAACCGLVWDSAAVPVPAAVLGGDQFNAEPGRQPYHDREAALQDATPLLDHLTQGELLRRLARLNRRLGWDHTTTVVLPMTQLATPELRGALWSALYAGSHAVLAAAAPDWDPAEFRGLLPDGSDGSD